MAEVTQILQAIERGDPRAASDLLPLVYDELRKLAAQRMAQEKPGQTLDATALVHEAYLRLVGEPLPAAHDVASSRRDSEDDQRWDGRHHFFAAAAEAMRRILIDNARRKARPKHGGGRKRIDLEATCSWAEDRADDAVALDEALTRLAAEDSAKAELVKLRYFAGLTLEEAAEVLSISKATAKRHWAYARAWLFAALNDPDEEGSS